jgi:ppGpp synthetase/RelA/SpoT-type nucleotidyltranferase
VIELQVRTALQHLWSEWSEKLSDVADPQLKYGGGAKVFRDPLLAASVLVAGFEEIEPKFHILERRSDVLEETARLRAVYESQKAEFKKSVEELILAAERVKGERSGLSNGI